MRFGAMFLADLPVKRLVELAKTAESAGFDYFWLNDCDVLFRNPWPVFAHIAEHTDSIRMGPLVTNPVTRDWMVTAGLFATLNEISGGRMACGVGRGDVAVRIVGKKAAKVADMGRFIDVVRDLVAGRDVTLGEHSSRMEWSDGWHLEMWGAGYGPKTLNMVGRSCDGFVMQAADPSMIQWARSFIEEGAASAGRDPADVRTMVAAPAYVSADLAHAHDQVRWFGGVVANHVAELTRRYGDAIPNDLQAVLAGHDEYQVAVTGASGHGASDHITDEVNARFSILGDADEHITKLKELERLGVETFSLYLNHDAIEQTMEAYATQVIPAFNV